MAGLTDIDYVLAKLRWMETSRIWPNGKRYLWTDAFDGYVAYQLLDPHALARDTRFAFTNYGVSIGLQAVGARQEQVAALNEFFDGYRSGDEYDREAITHVMACSSHFPGLLLADNFAGAGSPGSPHD